MPLLEPGSEEQLKTNLIYGASGAGKTLLACTMPRVALLTAGRERGFVTIDKRNLDPAFLYEPNVYPTVFAVASIQEFMQDLLRYIIPGVQQGKFRTIVVELTFYSDEVMRHMDVDERNGWAKYANLEQHVHLLDEKIKAVPGARLCYTTLVAPEDRTKETSGVLIPGKALAKKLPAMCDLTGYLMAEPGEPPATDRVLYLSAVGNYQPRHRYGTRLPPFFRWPGGKPVCMFRDIEDVLAGRARVDASGLVTREAAKTVSLPPLKRNSEASK